MNRLQYGQNNDILQFIISSGMINISDVQSSMESMKRKELLSKHPYKIWQGKEGKWYTYLPDINKGRRLIKKSALEDLNDVIVEYWDEQSENPTIEEIFEEWNDRRLELKKICQSTHNRYAACYKRHYEEFGKKRIKNIRQDEIIDFLEEQISEFDMTAKGFSGLLGITRGFLKYAKRNNYINFSVEETLDDMDLTDASFKKTIKEDYQEVFNEEEMQKMIRYLTNNLDTHNIGLLLIFVSGIRVGELVTLKHSDFSSKTVSIRRTETCYKDSEGHYHYEIKEFPKTSAGVRDVVIPQDYQWLLEKIRLLNPFSEFVFLSEDGDRMITRCIRSRLEKICKKLGIYHKTPHKMRKTYGTILLDNNIDRRFVIEQMGHADITVSENHYHINRRTIDKKEEVLSSLMEFKAQ